MGHFWKAMSAGAVLLALSSPAAAQATCATNGCSVAVAASATVNDVMRLTLSSATTGLGTPTEADYDAGFRDASGPTATVKSNRPWHVDVAAAAGSFSYTGSLTNPNKPASDLQWGTVSGTYGNNSGTSAVLFNGNGTGNSQQAIFFRTLWSWASDVPGAYSLSINFTIAAP